MNLLIDKITYELRSTDDIAYTVVFENVYCRTIGRPVHVTIYKDKGLYALYTSVSTGWNLDTAKRLLHEIEGLEQPTEFEYRNFTYVWNSELERYMSKDLILPAIIVDGEWIGYISSELVSVNDNGLSH